MKKNNEEPHGSEEYLPTGEDEVSLVPNRDAPAPPTKLVYDNPYYEAREEKPKIYRLTIGSLVIKIEQPPLVVSILLALGAGFLIVKMALGVGLLVVKLAEIAAFVIIVLALLSSIVYMPRNLPEDKNK